MLIDDLILSFEQYPYSFYLLVGLYSLFIGSFLNVVIYRVPKMLEQVWTNECKMFLVSKDEEEEVAKSISEQQKLTLSIPRSTCPSCNHKLRIRENIPVLSWLFLKGKCSQCKNPISKRYPIIECATSILSVLIAVHYGFTLETLFGLILTWSLICLALIDYDHMLLPDQITIPLIWLGLLVNINGYFVTIESAVIGAAVGYGFLYILGWIYQALTGKIAMGHGDYKLVAAFGAWFGWYQLPEFIFMASLAMTCIGGYLIYFKKRSRDKPLAFGPYLAIGGWVTLLYGENIKQWLF
jgi:leader peptidase (prepilin peptidase)/N-methyltransferase